MIIANNTQQFNKAKLRYLIQDHYDGEKKEQNLIDALNSFKTNFEKDNENNKRTFYVGEDTLKTNQCIAFFYVPNTQNNNIIGKHAATYVQTSDDTPQGEIIGVYYANIYIGQEDNESYNIRCYYLKDRCCDKQERELCGNVKMELKTEGGGLTSTNHKACLSITGEKNFDFLHDVNACISPNNRKEHNTKTSYFVQNQTYVRMFIKNKKTDKIDMKEFNTKFAITTRPNRSTKWEHVLHDGLTNGKEAKQPLSTIPIPEDNYQNPVMLEGNNSIKTIGKTNLKLEPKSITLQSKVITGKDITGTEKIIDPSFRGKVITKKDIQSNPKTKQKGQKNNEIQIDNNSEAQIEQEGGNNNNLIKINTIENDDQNVSAEERQDEELKRAPEGIKTLNKKIKTLEKENEWKQRELKYEKQLRKEAEDKNKELTTKITSQTQQILELSEENEKLKKENGKRNEKNRNQLYNQHNEKIDKLKEENEQQQYKIKELEKKVKEQRDNIKELNKKNKEREEGLNKAQQQFKEQVASLELEERKRNKKITTLNANNNKLTEQNEILEKRVKELESELEKQVKDQESELQQKYSSENQKLKEQLKDAEVRLEQHRQTIEELKNDKSTQYNIAVNSAVQENKELKQQFDDFNKNNDQLKEKNIELTKKNEILEKKIAELNEKITTYEEQGMVLATQQSQVQQEYNSKIIALDGEYRTTIKTLNANNDKLTKKNEILEKRVKELESELNKQQELIKNLEEEVKQIDFKNTQERGRSVQQTTRNIELTKKNEILEKRVKELESKLNKKYSNDANNLLLENKQLNNSNKTLTNDYNKLKKELEEIKKQLTQKTNWKENLITSKQVEIKYDGGKKINNIPNTNLQQQTQAPLFFKSNNNINTKYENEIKSFEQLKNINNQLNNQIAQQQKDIYDYKNLKIKMLALESDQRSNENTIQLQEKTIQNNINKMRELNEKLQNQQKTQNEIDKKNKELQDRIKQYEEQIKELDYTIKNTKQKINNSNQTNQTLKNEKENLEITNKKLQEEIAKLKEETEKLTNDNIQLNAKLLIPTQQNNEAQQKPTISQENKNDIDIKIRQKLEILSRDELIEKAIDFLNIAQRNSTETQNLKERLEQLSRENEKQKENNALQQDNTIKQKDTIIIHLQNDMRQKMKIHEEDIQILFKHYEDLYQQNKTNIETINNLQQILNKQKEVNPQPIDDDKNNKIKNDNLTKQNSVITNAHNELITPSQLAEVLKKQNQSNDKNKIEVKNNLPYNTESKETKPQQQRKELKENVKPKDKTTTQNLKIQYPQKQTKQYETTQEHEGGPTYYIVPSNNAYNNNNINTLHPEIVEEEKNNEVEQHPINNNRITNYVPQIRDRTTEGIYNQYIKPYQEQMLENTNIIGSKEEQKNITPTYNLCKQNNFISPSNPQNQIHKDNNNYKSDINKNKRKNKNTTTKKYSQQQKNDMHLNLLLRQLEDNQKNAEKLLRDTGNMFRKQAKKVNKDKDIKCMYMRAVKQSSNKPIKGNHNIVQKYCPVYNN